jgi:hypothetical protein
MLPDIAMMGTAMRGVFAVEEVIKFGEEVNKLADAYNGVAEAERVIASVGKENESIMESLARKSRDYARAQVTLLLTQTTAAELALATAKKADEGQTQQLATLIPLVDAYHFWFGASKEVIGAQKDLANVTKLRDQLVKILGEDEDKAYKKSAHDAAEAAKRPQRRRNGALRRVMRASSGAARADKETARIAWELNLLGERRVALLREEDTWRIRVEGEMAKEVAAEFEEVHQRELSNRLLKEMKDESERLHKVWANAHPLAANMREDLRFMGIEAKGLTITQMELTAATKQFSVAMMEQVMAVQRNMAASAEQLAAGLAGLIGGRRA